MGVTVGIPRGLLYYKYGWLWEEFFRLLGADVVLSSETSQQTINSIKTIDDFCLPVKVYLGHVNELGSKVDYLFVPRVVSIEKGQYTCPKLMGIPDIVRANVACSAKIIDVCFDKNEGAMQFFQAVINAGNFLNAKPWRSIQAWYQAGQSKVKEAYLTRVRYGSTGFDGQNKQLMIGVVGHPYLVFDKHVSMNLIGKLEAWGIQCSTLPNYSVIPTRYNMAGLDKKIYWSDGEEMVEIALQLLGQDSIDGLLCLSSFSCGQDSMLNDIIKRQAQAVGKPFMQLTLDEHTAEAGFVTRLEAYVDMFARRKAR